MGYVVALATCGMLAGCTSLRGIAEWAALQTPAWLRALGARRDKAPSEPTFRRVLPAVGPGALQAAVRPFLTALVPVAGQAIALDGKTLRGARDAKGQAPHLVSALAHDLSVVLAQVQVAEKTNEITSVVPLLDGLDITGAVVTGDAMFAQTSLARHLVEEKQADYLVTVKDNQPTLKADIEALELSQVSPRLQQAAKRATGASKHANFGAARTSTTT